MVRGHHVVIHSLLGCFVAGGSLENYGAIPEEVLGSIVVSVSLLEWGCGLWVWYFLVSLYKNRFVRVGELVLKDVILRLSKCANERRLHFLT